MPLRLLLAFAVTALTLGSSLAQAPQQRDPEPDAASSHWQQISAVLRHPRCLNCHTNSEFPRQGDDRHRHHQLVLRGAQNQGVPSLRCSSCHQRENTAEGKVPGAPHWQLAPLSMGWESLDESQLCAALKNRGKNGNRDLAALQEHMTHDPLVQWAWSPGARAKPSVAQEEFHQAVKAWVADGGPCP